MWCSIQYYAHTHTHTFTALNHYKKRNTNPCTTTVTWFWLVRGLRGPSYTIYIYIYNLSIVTTYMGTWWIWWMCPIWQIKTKQNKNNTYVIVYMVKIFPMFFSTRPVFLPITVSDSCSFQTGEESDEVFSCCIPSALRSSMVRCFSAHRGGYLSLNQAP